jgi:hypothetical protein
MGKWLVGAGIAILVMLVLLWRQLDDSSATAAPPPAKHDVAAVPPSTATMPAATKPAAAKPVDDTAPAVASSEAPKKIEVESDAFFYKFQEVVPAMLSRNAVKCYEGISKRVHRNQNVVYKFKVKIKDGNVTISNVEVERSSLGDNNAALQTCFLQEIARTTWSDPELPDWEADDQLTISPERGLKKYTRENIEYVGEPAPP